MADLNLNFGTGTNNGTGGDLRAAMSAVQDAINERPTAHEVNEAVVQGIAASGADLTSSYMSQVTNAVTHLLVGLVGSGIIAPASASDPDTWMGMIRGIALGPLVANQSVSVTRSAKVTDTAWNSWTIGSSVFAGEAGAVVRIPPTSGFIQKIGTVTALGEITVTLGEPQEILGDLVAGAAVYTRAGYGNGLTLASVSMGQFRRALEASGSGRCSTVNNGVSPDPGDPVNIAWEYDAFVTPGGVLATSVQSILSLSTNQMAAIFANALTQPSGG